MSRGKVLSPAEIDQQGLAQRLEKLRQVAANFGNSIIKTRKILDLPEESLDFELLRWLVAPGQREVRLRDNNFLCVYREHGSEMFHRSMSAKDVVEEFAKVLPSNRLRMFEEMYVVLNLLAEEQQRLVALAMTEVDSAA